MTLFEVATFEQVCIYSKGYGGDGWSWAGMGGVWGWIILGSDRSNVGHELQNFALFLGHQTAYPLLQFRNNKSTQNTGAVCHI